MGLQDDVMNVSREFSWNFLEYMQPLSRNVNT